MRQRALEEGKMLLIPSPRLKTGFMLLNPSEIQKKLYREAKRSKAEEAFNKLRKIISSEDLGGIERSSREFREGFKLR
ncbi:hypothetical protein FFONT_0146 [Fervidicoccus fontis Kam940]|uniref:Uncharacterized protein n=3 Tax=Fervidicoccus fontis TaxID=683846 RepID=H9ZZI1_FERFK|nr:hypothetical protein FFONT_0146 [Fervidicoccus fontis Kam940]